MRVVDLRLRDFRSFIDSEMIQLATINVLVGANNAGKSSVLRGLYLMQDGAGPPFGDVRVGAVSASIQMGLAEVPASGSFDDCQKTKAACLSASNRTTGALGILACR